MSHKCFIGLLNDYDNTGLLTISDLLNHINETSEFCNYMISHGYHDLANRKSYSLTDYCDRRKSTDVTRFDYCPKCGTKIDWAEIRRSQNE